MRLLEQQMAERRERILAAAREIIGERGYEALTMRDLARASRVTVPTIYNLVGGKEQVLFAAVEEQTERFVASIEPGHPSDGATPAARVLSVVEACCRELSRQPRYYRSLLKLMLTSAGAAGARRGRRGAARPARAGARRAARLRRPRRVGGPGAAARAHPGAPVVHLAAVCRR